MRGAFDEDPSFCSGGPESDLPSGVCRLYLPVAAQNPDGWQGREGEMVGPNSFQNSHKAVGPFWMRVGGSTVFTRPCLSRLLKVGA